MHSSYRKLRLIRRDCFVPDSASWCCATVQYSDLAQYDHSLASVWSTGGQSRSSQRQVRQFMQLLREPFVAFWDLDIQKCVSAGDCLLPRGRVHCDWYSGRHEDHWAAARAPGSKASFGQHDCGCQDAQDRGRVLDPQNFSEAGFQPPCQCGGGSQVGRPVSHGAELLSSLVIPFPAWLARESRASRI